ncbi:hypothetical protein MF672_002245 [Actinomadura sp. ATCC 31491]|uniref:Uncharacterized protein n=1 Tax=Actinomadura luzonensis TaxID=2805427 RepID=A0ABT0FK39_9ACTN|nr:hypothetical protein [Actinomadura luzonensis]MCK2212624.1 hypothetical protein [Actinomadura luzonensis]
MPSYIAEEQRGAEARILNALFPEILQGLQLTHQAGDEFGAEPRRQPAGPRMEHRHLEYRQPSRQRYPDPESYAHMLADRSFMDVAAVLMPVVQAITPPLVEQLLSFGPPKAEIDRHEEDRLAQFVPQLVATIAPIVTQVLPGLLQSMHGVRAGHPVRVTDHELNQRYLGPILQAMLPAIVTRLPELLAVVHGDQRPPVRHERLPGHGELQVVRISRNDLVHAHRLPDGDVIQLSETAAPPGTTEVRISTAPHALWWKGVQVTGDGDREICFAGTDGEPEASFDSRAAQSGGVVVLWKAQLFGVRTPMYVIPISELSPDGKCLTFHWAAD